jgi:hypothetical protein
MGFRLPPPPPLSGVSSASTSDAARTGSCGSGVFVAEETDAVKDNGSGNNTTFSAESLLQQCLDLGLFSPTAGASASGFKEFYCIHVCIYGMSIIKCN